MNKFIAGALLFFSASTYTYTNLDVVAIGNTFYAEGAVVTKKRTQETYNNVTPEIFSNDVFRSKDMQYFSE